MIRRGNRAPYRPGDPVYPEEEAALPLPESPAERAYQEAGLRSLGRLLFPRPIYDRPGPRLPLRDLEDGITEFCRRTDARRK